MKKLFVGENIVKNMKKLFVGEYIYKTIKYIIKIKTL